ncbi:segregation and condensation protein B [Propionigenium maris DSM 9537]|uniref:Segregation and condensation protein B n=1 Tax=Propionigenium maris DSM 9537 TaxID=1123000 RepID=A0A9W6GKA5_9FUSO|nr:SMC-Scp complex subunit ScpB [Propionigenium maris]GLI55732.1 segregation and condensation protein B [Propionigenium maris DSM 9537]
MIEQDRSFEPLENLEQIEIPETKAVKNREIMKRDIEAILLLSGDDLQIEELSKYFKKGMDTIKDILFDIREEMRDRGINLYVKGGRVYLATNPKSGETVHCFFNQESRPKKLSAAAMETLSIIAYRQPVTKGDVEDIRGVAVDGVMSSLEEKKLIAVCGKREGIGRPNLYEVTDTFLAYMGIESVEELPNYREVRDRIDGKDEDK